MTPAQLLDRLRPALTTQRALLHRDPPLAARVRRDGVALARLLAEVPPDLFDVDREAWAEAARLLAKVGQSERPVGAVLYDTELSEKRLGRLLRGGFATREGGRWLAAKEVGHADIAQLLALDLCRAAAAYELLQRMADDIALDYARAARRHAMVERRHGDVQQA